MIRCVEGRNDRNRIAVLSNATDIPVRLKEVNRDFFVMLNRDTQRYEIHCASQPFDTLACTLPFDALDGRALTYVREYAPERFDVISAEVDAYNERLAAHSERDVIDRANYKMREAFNYLKNNSKTDVIPQEVIDE